MKTKKKVLRKLTGLWGQLALQPGGSHVVQACFTFAVRDCSYQCQGGCCMLALLQPVCVITCEGWSAGVATKGQSFCGFIFCLPTRQHCPA